MQTQPRPNFLLLLPDQHRPDWLGNNPDLPLRTPNLDRLRARGTWFPHALSPSPLCAPARACLASGKDYAHCGVASNGVDYPVGQPTFYRALRDAGYRVGGVGKFDLHKPTYDWGPDGRYLFDELGFTDGQDGGGKGIPRKYSDTLREPYMAYLAQCGLATAHVEDHRSRRSYTDTFPTPLPDVAYHDNWVAENGLCTLRGFPSGQPWLLQVNFPGPHNPMDVTESMARRWEGVEFPQPHNSTQYYPETHVRIRRNYAAMIENIDRQCGRLLDAVRERGELKRTIVVYTSDHGEMLGDLNLWGKRWYYQPSAGVPLIVAGPGIGAGVASEALVVAHDLAATFLDYAGAPPLPEMDACSLRPVLEGQGHTHREYARSAYGNWRLVYDGRFKYVEREGEQPLLFDQAADPWETESVAGSAPDEAARLAQALG